MVSGTFPDAGNANILPVCTIHCSLLLITRQSARLICLGCKIIQSVVQSHNYSYSSYLQFNLLITSYIQVFTVQTINKLHNWLQKFFTVQVYNLKNRQRVYATFLI